MLIAFQILELELIARVQLGELALGFGILVVRALLIENRKSVEFNAVACGCEAALTVNALRYGVSLRLNGILNTGCHQACNKTLPNKRVELILV